MTRGSSSFFKATEAASQAAKMSDIYQGLLADPRKLAEFASSDLLDKTDEQGRTVFFRFGLEDRLALALQLLKLGADPTLHPENDYDALTYMKLYSEEEISKLKAADAQALPELIALTEGYMAVNSRATAPVFQPYNSTMLQAMVVSENYETAKQEISAYKDIIKPNLVDTEGKTILILAAKMNRLDMVNHLLETLGNRVEVNAQDNSGASALHYAAAYGNFDMIRCLLDQGARSVADKQGLLPIDYFNTKTEAEVLRFLDEVAIDGLRDISVDFNDNQFDRGGEEFGVHPNAVPAIRAHLEGLQTELNTLLNTNPAEAQRLSEYLVAVESKLLSYAGKSIVEQVRERKSQPDVELLKRMSPQVAEEKEGKGPAQKR